MHTYNGDGRISNITVRCQAITNSDELVKGVGYGVDERSASVVKREWKTTQAVRLSRVLGITKFVVSSSMLLSNRVFLNPTHIVPSISQACNMHAYLAVFAFFLWDPQILPDNEQWLIYLINLNIISNFYTKVQFT